MERLYKLLLSKEKEVQSKEDKEKVSTLKCLLKQEDIFFKLEAATAIGILEFLGVPKNEIRDYYLNLISVDNFGKLKK